MKKLYFALALALLAFTAQAQVPRNVLAEAFSNASCPPCAAQNPAYNAGMDLTGPNVIKLKYQTNWPGVDPMNAQTQTWVGPRVTYYGITGVPNYRRDAAVSSTPWNATSIANYYEANAQVNAPFSLEITHTLNAALDSAYVQVIITAAQVVNQAQLYLRLAMTEKEITFATAPGTNGEKDFHYVARAMYPNATGTALNAAWANAETQTLNFAVAIPAYIYDKSELSFVGFLQNDVNKAIHQAGYSQPSGIANDGKGIAASIVTPVLCNGTQDLNFTFKYAAPAGAANLTSADIIVKLDGVAVDTVAWTGNLAPGGSDTVLISGLPTGTPGTRTFTVEINITGDPIASNNDKEAKFVVLSANIVPTFAEAFLNAGIPANWAVENPDNGPTWTRVSATAVAGNGGSARMDFYNSASGQVDNLFLQRVDLTGTELARISWKRASAPYSNENDRVQLQVSTNCGQSWATLWDKQGAALRTAPATTSAYSPSASQWVNDTVSLDNYLGDTDVLLRFRATSAYGNNAFFDNINVERFTPDTTTGITDANFGSFSLYPNPATSSATVSFTLNTSETVAVSVQNLNGQTVLTLPAQRFNAGQAANVTVPTAQLAPGLYLVNVNTGNGQRVVRLAVTR